MQVNISSIPADLKDIVLSGTVQVTEFTVKSETWKMSECWYVADISGVTVAELIEIAFSGASLHVRHQADLRKLTAEQVKIAANRSLNVRERLDREKTTPTILSKSKIEAMIEDMIEAGLDRETALAIVQKQINKENGK